MSYFILVVKREIYEPFFKQKQHTTICGALRY